MKFTVMGGCILLSVAIAMRSDAAVILGVTYNPKPHPALDSYTIRAIGTAGEKINGIAGLTISGLVHNVTPAFGVPSTTRLQWDAPNGAGQPSWQVYDTHLLFNQSVASEVVGFIGSAQESNDGSDPAGLDLDFGIPGTDATEGLGFYRFAA